MNINNTFGHDYSEAEKERQDMIHCDAKLEQILIDNVNTLFHGEIAFMLQSGFDVVCDVASNGKASELVMACAKRQHTLDYAVKHAAIHGKAIYIGANGTFTYY